MRRQRLGFWEAADSEVGASPRKSSRSCVSLNKSMHRMRPQSRANNSDVWQFPGKTGAAGITFTEVTQRSHDARRHSSADPLKHLDHSVRTPKRPYLRNKAVGGFPGGSDGKQSACSVGDPDSIPGPQRAPGEGNGNPLQYSCLENPMDSGAWSATAHGAAKSRTWLSNVSFSRNKAKLTID